MTQTNTITAGIDTSKHKLDIAVHGSGKLWQVENAISGWRRLAADLAKLNVTRVGIEASGGYEQAWSSICEERASQSWFCSRCRSDPTLARICAGPRTTASMPF